MEIVFILVWKMRQAIEFQKSRAMVQSLLAQKDADNETIKKVFDELKEAFFPFDRNVKKEEDKKWRQRLETEIARGPLVMTPTVDTRSPKVKSKLEKGQREMARKLSMEKSGQMVDMDAFQKARRRPRGAS